MTGDLMAWDADLTPEAVKRLRPSDKGLRAVTSLTRKVETLEKWGRDGLPDGRETWVPWDRAKLRRWKDVDAGLWPWADPVFDAMDGRNAALMDRWRLALEVVKVRRKDKGINLKKAVEAKDAIIANLERQNLALLDQVRRLQMLVGKTPLVRR